MLTTGTTTIAKVLQLVHFILSKVLWERSLDILAEREKEAAVALTTIASDQGSLSVAEVSVYPTTCQQTG